MSRVSESQWCASAFCGSRRIARRRARSASRQRRRRMFTPPIEVCAEDRASSSARARIGARGRAIDRDADRHVAAASHHDPAIGEPEPRVGGTRVALDRAGEVGDRALDRGARALVPVVSALRAMMLAVTESIGPRAPSARLWRRHHDDRLRVRQRPASRRNRIVSPEGNTPSSSASRSTKPRATASARARLSAAISSLTRSRNDASSQGASSSARSAAAAAS